jgi:hypothetical protein
MHNVSAINVIVLSNTPNARIGVENHFVWINMSDFRQTKLFFSATTQVKVLSGVSVERKTVV